MEPALTWASAGHIRFERPVRLWRGWCAWSEAGLMAPHRQVAGPLPLAWFLSSAGNWWEIGHPCNGGGFHFGQLEAPRHRVWLEPLRLSPPVGVATLGR